MSGKVFLALLITGDRARLDENGYLYFGDRTKDMMKAGEKDDWHPKTAFDLTLAQK